MSAPTVSKARARLPLALLISWLTVSSSAVVIVVAAPIPPLTIAASRVAITALAWMAIGALTGRTARLRDVDVRARRRIGLSGVLLGTHFALWISSLTLTSVVHGAVLVALQPLFAGLFGLFLGDKATLRLVIGVAVAMLGTLSMTRGDAGDVTLLGDLLAVLAGACGAAYLVVNRGIGARVPLATLLGWVNAVACASIVAWIAISGAPMWHPDATRTELFALLWLGVGPGLLGHGLMNWAARLLPVHVVSLTVLLEPIGAAGLAWVVLDQTVGASEAFGAALLLVGAGVAVSAQRK